MNHWRPGSAGPNRFRTGFTAVRDRNWASRGGRSRASTPGISAYSGHTDHHSIGQSLGQLLSKCCQQVLYHSGLVVRTICDRQDYQRLTTSSSQRHVEAAIGKNVQAGSLPRKQLIGRTMMAIDSAMSQKTRAPNLPPQAIDDTP